MTAPAPGQRMLTFRSGGYALVLAGLATIALIVWAVAPAVLGLASRPPGNGRDVETYRFDLSSLQVERDLLTPAMRHRDMVQPVSAPPLLLGRDMARINQTRGKFVLDSDRVVGVVVDGEARAYPVSVLNVHEVIHDTLAGRPVAVTYHWPCDSAVVFERQVDGRTLEFGVSGLLYNSNQLLYDRGEAGEPGGESLWSQMLARAVSGPAAAAGLRLRTIPCQLASWRQWFAEHPDTTVADRDPSIVRKRYAKASPEQYFRDGRIRYPVSPGPPEDGPPPLTRVVAVQAGGERLVYTHDFVEANADDEGVWSTRLGGVAVQFDYDQTADTVYVTAPPGVTFAHAAWFAWHAMHPHDTRAE